MDSSVREFIEPIRKKWIYHFIVSPKTSLIEKPEWYLNQSLKWIHEHLNTVETIVKPGSAESCKAEVRRAFILCMLELSHRRLQKDLESMKPKIEESEETKVLLVHTYNEVVQYVRVIRQLLGSKYEELDDKHDMMALFSQQIIFEKLFDVEWDNALRNLRATYASECRWDPVLDGDYIDYYKIPRCVDRFLLQIKSISERVECFRQPDCQFQLIELQSYLFKKSLDFMRQTTECSPISKNILTDIFFITDDSTIDLSKILRVLNGVNFLRLVLKERCFLPPGIEGKLDEGLSAKLKKTTEDYVTYMNKLIDRVVSIYEEVRCDHRGFLDFIKPKLSNNIYELIHDEAAKIYQKRQTHSMLKGLSLGRE